MQLDDRQEKWLDRGKSAGKYVWARLTRRLPMNTITKIATATTIAGSVTVGAVSYSQAQEARREVTSIQNQIKNLDDGVIIVPEPGDDSEAIKRAQDAADAADAKATDAGTKADDAQATADAAIPTLHVFGNHEGTGTIGEFNLIPGTYEITYGATLPFFVESEVPQDLSVVFSDGRSIDLNVSGTNGAVSQTAYLTFRVDTEATLTVGSGTTPTTFPPQGLTLNSPYVKVTRLQGGN